MLSVSGSCTSVSIEGMMRSGLPPTGTPFRKRIALAACSASRNCTKALDRSLNRIFTRLQAALGGGTTGV